MAENIGTGHCPFCKGDGARFSVSKKGLAVMTCTQRGCGIQAFSRSDDGDENMRRGITGKPVAAPAPAPEKTPEKEQTPAPAAAEKAIGWGMLKGIKHG